LLYTEEGEWEQGTAGLTRRSIFLGLGERTQKGSEGKID